MENYIMKVSFKNLSNLIAGFTKPDSPRIVGICRVVRRLKFKNSKKGGIFHTGDLIFLVQIESIAAKRDFPRIFVRGTYYRLDEVETVMKNGTPVLEEIGILNLSNYLYIIPADNYDLYDEDEEPEEEEDDEEDDED